MIKNKKAMDITRAMTRARAMDMAMARAMGRPNIEVEKQLKFIYVILSSFKLDIEIENIYLLIAETILRYNIISLLGNVPKKDLTSNTINCKEIENKLKKIEKLEEQEELDEQ